MYELCAQFYAMKCLQENATGPGSLHVATVNLQSQHDCEGVHGYLGVTCQCADADGVGPCTVSLSKLINVFNICIVSVSVTRNYKQNKILKIVYSYFVLFL